MGKLSLTGDVACDTETTGLKHWQGDRAFAVSMADEDLNTWYTEWPINPFTREVSPVESDVRFLRKVLGDPKRRKRFFNKKFDWWMLYRAGVEVIEPADDGYFAARVCRTNEFSYKLKFLSRKYCSIPVEDEKALQERVKQARREGKKLGYKLHKKVEADYWLPRVLDPEDSFCETYAVQDAVRTMVLGVFYDRVMDREDPRIRMTYEREMELWHDVKAMEDRGVAIDWLRNQKELELAWHRWVETRNKLREMSCEPNLNPNSTPQLVKIVYGKKRDRQGNLGLECLKYTEPSKNAPDGNPSVDNKALRPYFDIPFVGELIRHRAAVKGISFFEKYEELMVRDPLCPLGDKPSGNVIHTDIRQMGARTARFSMAEPNLQQATNPAVSARAIEFFPVRAAFGPRPGYVWIALDYGQQEVRIFAWAAKIQSMIDVLLAGGDVNSESSDKAWGGQGNEHAMHAASLALELGDPLCQKPEILDVWNRIGWDHSKCHYGYGSPQAHAAADNWLAEFNWSISKAEKSVGLGRTRNRAKILIFTKVYGGGAKAVRDILFCSIQEAKDLLRSYDRAFPEMQAFMNDYAAEADKRGYIYNLYDRRLNVDQGFGYRAVNYLVQGTAADMMKDSIHRCRRFLLDTGLDAHVLLTIHDELVFEIRRDHLYPWLINQLMTVMSQNDGRIGVPMVVEPKIVTRSWEEKVDYELRWKPENPSWDKFAFRSLEPPSASQTAAELGSRPVSKRIYSPRPQTPATLGSHRLLGEKSQPHPTGSQEKQMASSGKEFNTSMVKSGRCSTSFDPLGKKSLPVQTSSRRSERLTRPVVRRASIIG